METNLTKELRKYYQRGGNVIIFRNGLNLSDVALEMRAKLYFSAIDASVLSRVLNGQRSFTGAQLDAFCEVLDLSDHERWALQEASMEDLRKDGKPVFDFAVSPFDYVESLDHDILLIEQTRVRGDSHLARIMAEDKTEQVARIAYKASGTVFDRQLQRARGYLTTELALTFTDTLPSDQVGSVVKPLVADIKGLARSLEDKELYGKGYGIEAGRHYLEGNHAKSIKRHVMALDYALGADDQLWLRRALVVSLAEATEKGAVDRSEAEREIVRQENAIRGIISLGEAKPHQVCATLEGLGRAQGILGWEKCSQTLEEADELYRQVEESNEKAPMRAVQIARSTFEVVRRLAPRDTGLLESRGSRALQLAHEYGYVRHYAIIKKLLAK